MSRGVQNFKLTDLRRALRAAKAEGLDVASCRISKDGSIEVQVGKPATEAALAGETNEWDSVA